MTDKPAEIKVPKPTSRQKIISQNPVGRVRDITKSVVQKYIDTFFTSDKNYRNHLLLKSVVPQGIQYDTSKSFTDLNNPVKKKLHIYRMFNEFKQKMPAIIITDTSYNPRTDLRGMGMLNDAKLERGVWRGSYPVVSDIGIQIVVLSNDESTTNLLFSSLDLAFSSLRNIAGGSYITSGNPGENWAIRLPLTYSTSGSTRENVTDDNVASFWHSSFDLEVSFEGAFEIQMDGPMYLVNSTGQTLTDFGCESEGPSIVAPSSVSINSRFNIQLYGFDYTKHQVIVDDPNIAIIEPKSLQVTPKRLGTFKIQVIDKTQQTKGAFNTNIVVSEKEITVTWY
jgi:hypothetical protein